ncbi:MAG: Cysteine-tRNA ligase [Candidatus Uhrbacteria bacterium GW2011_GWF2_41_16]|uniref:Cysteine--tRNA ligase n=2 Tax=Candidatus Uhriibacteriota TaxID=1752732 RepID=A0A0G0YAY3_9BACT|nr:MAG: Cysteine-tRNA ligase [Candidatus Uhrbacteria bacterium GW2011_GWA2_41_10]KKR86654.1 MAG: Cysteine-tRNA ligase [Candidatus Uhrbacteria bacterium GW2011_GWC2_41_11]KKR97472.1 MAG: Cysteine-tRNA ligase [Candidatus Uhrbacteria bacterium GW2011_GWF2_41_16]HBP00156.1 cysteine--tRNA ligase [Candidatus Uhrbacteria bacterium]
MISFFNTLTRQKEEFIPLHPGQAGVYGCGPTVYWFAHIGNMRRFLFEDVLVRSLAYNSFQVKHIINITDVGHLVGDGDDGEDKMLTAMRREGKTAYEIAEFYTQTFFQDLKWLNIISADVYPKATEHITEQIAMVRTLEAKGYTYHTSDGIYFDTSKLPEYGRLSGQKIEEKMGGARVDMGEKKSVSDFALWKFSYSNGRSFDPAQDDVVKQRQMEWESPWGDGFPGWHIECSAMAKKYLGVPFDIHTGAIDLIPVHHENEIAQTSGADDVLEANIWMHAEFLTVGGGKMSKSLGNLYTVEDLIQKGYDPLAYRYLVLQAHYRTKLDFTFEALEAAQNALHRLYNIVREWDAPTVDCTKYEERFLQAINDDLNTSQALAIMWEMVGDTTLPSSARAQSLLLFDKVFGLQLEKYVGQPLEIPVEIQELAKKREQARKEKKWEESDRLRAEIELSGFVVEDTTEGSKVRTQ